VDSRPRAAAQDKAPLSAHAICKVVADWVPIAYGAFEDYRMGGVTLSSKAVDCVRRMLKGEVVTQETSGMSKGEWREFEGVIG
jgi:thymidylate synthase (FAD)